MKTAVITAIYDRYDTLKPAVPQEGVDVDWVCVTDDPGLVPDGWRIVHEPRLGVHPNRAAKHPKFFPWKYTDAEASVWIDASFRVKSSDFVAGALAYAWPIAQFVHPWRDCLFEEAAVSAQLPKYQPALDVARQTEDYRTQAHPEHWGLWATGVIARRHESRVMRLGDAWMNEVNRGSFQDQVSQPFVLRSAGLRPVSLPGTHFSNPWLDYEGSERH